MLLSAPWFTAPLVSTTDPPSYSLPHGSQTFLVPLVSTTDPLCYSLPHGSQTTVLLPAPRFTDLLCSPLVSDELIDGLEDDATHLS